MVLTSAPQLRAASFRVWLVPARVWGALFSTVGPCGHGVVRSREFLARHLSSLIRGVDHGL